MNMKFFRSSCALFLILGLYAQADEPIEWESVNASIEDVTVEGREPVRISVFYDSPVGVSERSFDDADLWVANSAGFHSGVTFVESNSLVPLPGPNGDFPPVRFSIAIYELEAPEGGWTREHNGEYAVMLAGDEVAKNDGSHFALALAGSFHVSIGEEKRVVPASKGSVSVATFPTPGVPGGNTSELVIATFEVTFPHPVEVNWSEVIRNDDGSYSVAVEGCEPDGFYPEVETSYSHRVELGMLERGEYSVSLQSGEEALAKEAFVIGGGGGGNELIKGLPSEVDVDIIELPTRGLYPSFAAIVRLTFGQYVDHVDWGEVNRKGEILSSDMTAWIDPRVRIFAPMVIEQQINLGMLLPGEYRYELTSLGEVIGRAPIFVPGPQGDLLPPQVTVDGASVTEPGEQDLEFSVEFFDESELEFGGIEAQVLFAMNRRGERFELERTSLSFTADMSVGAIATYRMKAPGGSWGGEDRGRYRLLLSEPELVSDLLGNHLTNPLIGYVSVEIEPDDPEPTQNTELKIINNEVIGRWTASVRLFVPEDLASRDDWSVNWGEVRPAGPSFFLRPRFVRAGSNEEIGLIPPSDTTGAGMWVEHDYDLGPISEGSWVVCLSSNLGHFAKERILEGDPDRPVEPFDSWNDWADRLPEIPDDRRFWEYCVGTNPGDTSDDHEGDPRPELIEGEDGEKHLGLRCRMAMAAIDARLRFEGSSDMNDWRELGPDEIEEIERVELEGGIEEFVVCLVDEIGTAEIRYLRVVAERW